MLKQPISLSVLLVLVVPAPGGDSGAAGGT